MTLLTTLVTAVDEKHFIIMPPIAFAIIAFLVFFSLGVLTWTYRDVANRHRNKFTRHPGPDSTGVGH